MCWLKGEVWYSLGERGKRVSRGAFMVRSETRRLDDAIDRLLLVSDVHGFLQPLEVFDRIRESLPGRHQVLFNGDLVEGGPQPAETMCWLRRNVDGLAVLGNHDEGMLRKEAGDDPPYTEAGAFQRLSAEDRAFFGSRPLKLVVHWRGQRIQLMHGHVTAAGGRALWRLPPEKQIANFIEPEMNLCVLGHTHYPYIRSQDGVLYANPGSMSLPILAVRDYHGLHPQSGKPQLGPEDDPRCSFLSLTENRGKLQAEIIRFDYDRSRALQLLEQVGHPQLANYRIWLHEGIVEFQPQFSLSPGD